VPAKSAKSRWRIQECIRDRLILIVVMISVELIRIWLKFQAQGTQIGVKDRALTPRSPSDSGELLVQDSGCHCGVLKYSEGNLIMTLLMILDE